METTNPIITVTTTEVNLNSQASASFNGTLVLIEGALANEKVMVEVNQIGRHYKKGILRQIITTSEDRVDPKCPNFGTCGGCSLQHLEFNAQIKLKQKTVIDLLAKNGNLKPKQILDPVTGIEWHYRNRARLSIFHDSKHNQILLGFKKTASTHITDMNECPVLPSHISDLIPKLRELINSLSIKNRIPQLEIAIGSNLSVLALRVLKPLTPEDQKSLCDFIDKYSKPEAPLQFWLQPRGPESCHPFYPPNMSELNYQLTDYGLTMPFYPTEFTQVNPIINQQMVKLAIKLLEPNQSETIADFFCGIGNFSLPIATLAQKVFGFEGSSQLVKRAQQNAEYNNLTNQVTYKEANLFSIDSSWLQEIGKFDKWLIDPPREGALELVKAITKESAPQKIVYVSCNPITLARDSAILTHRKGYELTQLGILNMFPHTAHVETIAVFNLIQKI